MPTSVEIISRDLFPIGSKVTNAYIKLLYGLQSQTWSDGDFKAAVEEVTKKRRDAASWGKDAVEGMIVTAAQKNGINCRTMMQLKQMFEDDPSPAFAARLWEACYGTFDHSPRWEFDLETTYMNLVCLEYKNDEDGKLGKKGCIAKLFCEQKKEIVKAINRYGARGHGGKLRVRRTTEEKERGGGGEKAAQERSNTLFFFLSGCRRRP